MVKQDMTWSRTPQDTERKYAIGKHFKKIYARLDEIQQQTEWQEVLTSNLNSGFSYDGVVGSIGMLKYKKIGDIVFIKGNVKGKIDLSGYTTVFTLPEEYRPETRVDFICPAQAVSGKGNRTVDIAIGSNGEVNVGAVNGQSYGTTNWFAVNVSFAV